MKIVSEAFDNSDRHTRCYQAWARNETTGKGLTVSVYIMPARLIYMFAKDCKRKGLPLPENSVAMSTREHFLYALRQITATPHARDLGYVGLLKALAQSEEAK
jgi:hypothetical protein